jgi:hypothetical protein
MEATIIEHRHIGEPIFIAHRIIEALTAAGYEIKRMERPIEDIINEQLTNTPASNVFRVS